MSLKETVNTDIKSAMKAKDQARLRALRSLKSAILNAEVAEGRNGEPLREDEELKILMRAAKQRKDSIQQYKENQREDLAQTETEELEVIETYLPKQLSGEELTRQVKSLIEELGASSMKDMGRVMGAATSKFAGKADGKAISGIVKQLLA